LIEAFVRQLRGELEITGDAGTSLVLRFPAAAKKTGEGTALAAGPASATPLERGPAAAAPVSNSEP
jgi:hypothetical protein